MIEDLEKKQIQEMETSDTDQEVILIIETMHHKLIQKWRRRNFKVVCGSVIHRMKHWPDSYEARFKGGVVHKFWRELP